MVYGPYTIFSLQEDMIYDCSFAAHLVLKDIAWTSQKKRGLMATVLGTLEVQDKTATTTKRFRSKDGPTPHIKSKAQIHTILSLLKSP